jgi:hypothetical protein
MKYKICFWYSIKFEIDSLCFYHNKQQFHPKDAEFICNQIALHHNQIGYKFICIISIGNYTAFLFKRKSFFENLFNIN